MLNEAVRSKILEGAAKGFNITETALYIGVWRQTLRDWFLADKEFYNHFLQLQDRPVLKAKETVEKSLSKPEYAFKYLSKKRPKEFGDKIDVTSGGKKIAGFNYILPGQHEENK